MTFMYILGVTAVVCIIGIIWSEIQLHKPEAQD